MVRLSIHFWESQIQGESSVSIEELPKQPSGKNMHLQEMTQTRAALLNENSLS